MAVEGPPTGVSERQRPVGAHRKVGRHRMRAEEPVRSGKHRRDGRRPDQPAVRHGPSSVMHGSAYTESQTVGLIQEDRSPATMRAIAARDGVPQWLDSLQDRKDELDQLAKEREQSGCVIRAVESAFGAKATIEEVKERLADVKLITKKWRNKEGSFEELLREDMTLNRQYYERLRTHNEPPYDTELGRAMSDYTMAETNMSLAEMHHAVMDGRKVIAAVFDNQQNVWHMMHLDYESRRGFISASDNLDERHTPLLENSPTPYHCFVFDKKQENGAQHLLQAA